MIGNPTEILKKRTFRMQAWSFTIWSRFLGRRT